jgi:hypothetical protein
MKLIGLCGYAKSGKSTAAHHLVETRGFWRVPFAGPLKAMLQAAGLSQEHTDGHLKEVPCDLLCGHTPRHAMQTLGTEWGRALGTDLWVNLWRIKVERLMKAGDPVIVDDVRFPNEADAIRALGGKVIKIERPGIERPSSHASEALDFEVDHILSNSGTKDELCVMMDAMIGPAEERTPGRCIPIDMGEKGVGYVVGLMTRSEKETRSIEKARKAVVYMISGPFEGMKITVDCTPDMFEEPTYN